MRATIAFLLVLLVAGILAMDTGEPARAPVAEVAKAPIAPARKAPRPARVQVAAAPLPAFPDRTPLTSGQDSRIPSDQLAAALPKPDPLLPGTLEVVTFPTSPGAKAAATKTISRTEAVAAAMGSPEYQDTVVPLARLYFAAFGPSRYPDYEGLNYYTGQREEARPLDVIATEFAGSKEFEARYGLLDNAEFVARILSNVLGHQSQPDVRAYWTAELDSGRMTRGQVIVDMAESGAFRERMATEVFVATAYTEVLRRTPDPKGFTYWVAQMHSGQPASAVIDGLLAVR